MPLGVRRDFEQGRRFHVPVEASHCIVGGARAFYQTCSQDRTVTLLRQCLQIGSGLGPRPLGSLHDISKANQLHQDDGEAVRDLTTSHNC